MTVEADRRWLDSAARLARHAEGVTGGAPLAATLIVNPDGVLLGRGVAGVDITVSPTSVALAEAGNEAASSVVYATVEPSVEDCAALASCGIVRAVFGMADPAGGGSGAAILRDARIAVDIAEHAKSLALNAPYLTRILRHRPFTTLVIAMSRDEMVASPTGKPVELPGDEIAQWLTIERRRADALLTGRHGIRLHAIPGLPEHQPLHVMPIGKQPPVLPGASDTVLFVAPGRAGDMPPSRAAVVELEGRNGRPDARHMATTLADWGVSRLHIEAGPRLSESFIAAELVDRLYLINSPDEIGRVGMPATPMGTIGARLRAAGFGESDSQLVGPNLLRTFERAV